MILMPESTITHHPKDETLASFAAGRLDEARAVVIATHLTLCDSCRMAVRDFETLGGVILEQTEPVDLAANALETFWSRAGEAHKTVLPASVRPANDFDVAVAQPLQRYLKGGLDAVEWRSVAPGLAQHVLKAEGYRPDVLRLLRIQPGTRIPQHTHKDGEITLVLRGAYEDELGRFGPGDFADLDGDHTHTPVAVGDEECVCLIATNAPLRFKSVVAKVVQPFIGL